MQSKQDRFRIVGWNMAHKKRAWKALDELGPHISLLTEAAVPDGRRGEWSPAGTTGRDGATRPWSAAVISELPFSRITDAEARWRQTVRRVPFDCSRPGSWAAATVETPLGVVTAVALYGLMDEMSDASVHRSLSELTPLFDDPRYNKLLVLGGDLNAGSQWPEKEPFYRRDRNLLERISTLGLVDCLRARRAKGRLQGCQCIEGEACEHTWTRRDPRRANVAFQNDYLFASRRLADRLESCQSLATPEWFSVSDHAPIVAEFRI